MNVGTTPLTNIYLYISRMQIRINPIFFFEFDMPVTLTLTGRDLLSGQERRGRFLNGIIKIQAGWSTEGILGLVAVWGRGTDPIDFQSSARFISYFLRRTSRVGFVNQFTAAGTNQSNQPVRCATACRSFCV